MGGMGEWTAKRASGNEFFPFDCDVCSTLIEDKGLPKSPGGLEQLL